MQLEIDRITEHYLNGRRNWASVHGVEGLYEPDLDQIEEGLSALVAKLPVSAFSISMPRRHNINDFSSDRGDYLRSVLRWTKSCVESLRDPDSVATPVEVAALEAELGELVAWAEKELDDRAMALLDVKTPWRPDDEGELVLGLCEAAIEQHPRGLAMLMYEELQLAMPRYSIIRLDDLRDLIEDRPLGRIHCEACDGPRCISCGSAPDGSERCLHAEHTTPIERMAVLGAERTWVTFDPPRPNEWTDPWHLCLFCGGEWPASTTIPSILGAPSVWDVSAH